VSPSVLLFLLTFWIKNTVNNTYYVVFYISIVQQHVNVNGLIQRLLKTVYWF